MSWVVASLLAVVGPWMTFDGSRALIVGDYVTPSRGDYAGELGPWSRVVEAVGIPARSLGMKLAFIVTGLIHLTAAASLVFGSGSPAHWVVVLAAVAGLWFLPFGTIADGVALGIVVLISLRPWSKRKRHSPTPWPRLSGEAHRPDFANDTNAGSAHAGIAIEPCYSVAIPAKNSMMAAVSSEKAHRSLIFPCATWAISAVR